MKKAICLFATMLILSACSAPQSGQEGTLEKVRRTNIIKAATVVFPPTTIKDAATGKLSGHMIESMDLIAGRIGAKVEWEEVTFGTATAALQSGRCDVVVAPLFANIERAEVVAFTSPPLFYLGLSALVKNGSGYEGVQNVFKFDKPDLTVAVAIGEAGDVFVKAKFHQAKVTRIDVPANELSRFMLEVSTGRADVAIADSEQIAKFAAEHEGVVDLFHDHQFDLNPAAWAVRYGDSDWLHFLETSLGLRSN